MLTALEEIGRLAAEVLASPLWQESGPAVVKAVQASAVAVRKVQAAHLSAVGELDRRPGVLEGMPAGYAARSYLQAVLHRTKGQAKLDVAAARALRADADPGRGGMRRLGVAFAAGEVSREHVEAAVRAVQALPKKLLPVPMASEDGQPLLDEAGQQMCAGDVVDEWLTSFAKDHDSYALAQLGKHLKDKIDPDGDFDPGKCLRRGARTWRDAAGMFHLKGEFDPAAGAFLESVLDQWSKPRPYEGEGQAGETLGLKDPRSPGQRTADAVVEMARAAQASGRLGTRGGEPPRVSLRTRPEDLAAARESAARRAREGGGGSAFFPAPDSASDGRAGLGTCRTPGSVGSGPDSGPGSAAGSEGDGAYLGTGTHVGPWLLARLACDAVLERALLAPNGAVLDLGREVRTVTPAQRRALTARDRGCIVPGCTVPAPWCEAHHVQFWAEGGRSDIGNYALVCLQHHTEVHTGMWVVCMKDGVPWVIPPDWADPLRRPARNRYHQQIQETRDLGTQLRLGLDDGHAVLPDESPPPSCPDSGTDAPPGTDRKPPAA